MKTRSLRRHQPAFFAALIALVFVTSAAEAQRKPGGGGGGGGGGNKTAPAPTNLMAAGTPTTATLSWTAPAGAIHYLVNRALAGTATWTNLTPTPITATTLSNDILPDPAQTYTYAVQAYQKNGAYGEATVNFKAPPPTNPASVTGSASGTTVTLSWPPVQHAAGYLVTGPGIAGTLRTAATAYSLTAPEGTHVYRVGAVFDPGAVQTAQTLWPSVTVNVVAPTTITSCACQLTFRFVPGTTRTVDGYGQVGGFGLPGVTTFTLTAGYVSGAASIDIVDAQNHAVLSVTNASAWALSPDARFFVVIFKPASLNTGSDVVVYRVAAGPGQWQAVINTQAWPDGFWGFSPEFANGGGPTRIFAVVRVQQNPIQYSFEAYNLLAPNPTIAVLRVSETNVYGPELTYSPCGDRLSYSRWLQINPAVAQMDFYARTSFGMPQTPVIADWDGTYGTYPFASTVQAQGAYNYLVQLSNAKVRNTGATSFSSLQCSL